MTKFITSPIYYVNGSPHLGHLYTSTAVDILARFEEIYNRPVFTSFGTDEHGQKVASAAIRNGKTPQEFADEMYKPFQDMLSRFNVEYGTFIRTTDDVHKKAATHFWEKVYASGLIYESSYSGWYSKVDEAYYKDDDVLDGKSIETGSSVEWIEEPCLFFAMSKVRDKLLKHYTNNPDAVKPKSKYMEVLGLLKADLPDLAITRSRFDWGISVPNHPGHVMYVWIDALSNYLTALGYPKNADYNKWWANSVHIIGKDILKFHAIYWPAFLIAAGLDLPKRIFAHGWWNVDGQKMSKSIGNVIDPFELADKYEIDCLRYYLFRETQFGSDANFSTASLHSILNTELANEIGNLVQRVLMFCYNKFGSTLPCNTHDEILSIWDKTAEDSDVAMSNQDIMSYLNHARSAVIATNRYIDLVKPWACNTDDMQKYLGILCFCVQKLAILYYPVIPTKSLYILKMLGIRNPNMDHWSRFKPFPLTKPVPIFTRTK